MSKIIYTEDKEPDMTGVGNGKVWAQDIKGPQERHPESVGKETTIGAWIIHAPGHHPFWEYYAIACIHLRDVPGMKPAEILLQGATHEIFIWALSPDHKVALNDDLHLLRPVNFTAQFIEESDSSAYKKVEGSIKEIMEGKLSPDTDYNRLWIARYGNSNYKG